MRETIVNLQATRGIATLIVVFIHVMLIEEKYSGAERLLPDFLIMGAGVVDIFFVLSGFIMVTVSRDQFQRPFAMVNFFYSRASRIYPIYWFYSFFALIVYLLRPGMVNTAEHNQVNLISSFLLLPNDKAPLLSPAWTLFFEMYFYSAFATLLFLKEQYLVRALVIWGVAVTVGHAVYQEIRAEFPLPLLELITHPLTAEFIAGCFIALVLRHCKPRYGWTALVGGLLFFLVAGGVFFTSISYEQIAAAQPKEWWRVVIWGIPAAAIVYGAVALEFASGKKLPFWSQKVGDASYSIYLSHILVLSALGRIWQKVNLPGLTDNVIWIVIMAIAVVSFGLASYRYLEFPLLSMARRLRKYMEARQNTVILSPSSVKP